MGKNIVLIGFMGSGKTSIGKAISVLLKFDFIDIDSRIENKMKMPVSRIFSVYGENKFRRIESEIIREASKTSCNVIAAGGGAVLDPKNIKMFKKNGVIVSLISAPNSIIRRIKNDRSRPLAAGGIEKLIRLYDYRFPFYIKNADLIADTSIDEPKKLAKEIFECLKKNYKIF